MELYDTQNGGIRDNSAGAFLSPREARIEKCFRYYRANFHLITIPIIAILAIIHLIYGIEYLGQCTIQPMINIYMIVNASVALFIILLALSGVIIVRCIYPNLEEENHKMIARRLILIVVILTLIVLLFSLAWLVVGSVWIFGAKSNGVQGSDPMATTTYCQSNLYRAAFTLVIVNYIVHGLIILMIIMRRIRRNRHDTVPPPAVATNRV
jgi:amino acid transporter